jgi:DNA polymerase III subunit gamma/tau
MNDAENRSLDLGTGPTSYRVLARKYRPSTFDDLIGQNAMVRTIGNAFDTGRIPQAWILTGVRGVGKTTTARIIARALNYELSDGSVTVPTVTMPVPGIHCDAILESRHIDVLEMDAASHNGVNDIRQINEAIRYSPVSARYKVYILDEVHMLSTPAFNALLKTLEEPPPHAKFIFATTEVGDVPITVLSRCQRFDLRRVDAALLVKHLSEICKKESVSTEPDALALIARAAEGSVRDALSILDQAIAHAGGVVRADDVRRMLGLADRTRIIDLFDALMRGDMAAAFKELRDQYDSGADPGVVLTELAEFTNFITRVKIVPSAADDVSLGETERVRGRSFAAKLSMRVLSRAWQMLLKGITEVKEASLPIAAAEMVLVRIAYAADLPTPDEVIRSLSEETGAARPAGSMSASTSASVPAPSASRYESARGTPRTAVASAIEPMPRTAETGEQLALARFEDLLALAAQKRELQIKAALERDVRLVRFEDGRLEIALEPSAPKTLVHDLSSKLSAWTGNRWMVVVSAEQGAPTLRSQAQAEKAEMLRGVRADPLVQAVLTRFPGAEIVDVRRRDGETFCDAAPGEADDPSEQDDDV